MVQVKGGNHKSPSFVNPIQKTLNRFKANGIHADDAGSSASAHQLWVKESKWTPNNNWVVAYGSLTGDAIVDQRAKNMIIGGAGEYSDYGGVLGTLAAEGFNGNLSPGNNAESGTVFTLYDSSTRSSLLSYLADTYYENFYYFGHGNNAVISAYNGSVTALTRDQISYALGNVPLSDTILHADEHPYRFVWIDACNTGKANFCEAFGIPAFSVSTNFFAATGVESRAFIGFSKETSFDDSNSSLDPSGWPNRSSMMHDFLYAWLHNQGDLQTIVQNAKNSFGEFGYKMDSSVIIYGASDLMNRTHTRP